jgi:hypothetical protein
MHSGLHQSRTRVRESNESNCSIFGVNDPRSAMPSRPVKYEISPATQSSETGRQQEATREPLVASRKPNSKNHYPHSNTTLEILKRKMAFSRNLLVSIAAVFLLVLPATSSCHVPLNSKHHDCIARCTAQDADDTNTFICDQTVPWLHHLGGSNEWFPATPPLGTGVHTYSLFRGTAPCTTNGHCSGCSSPSGELVCSVQIDPEDCSITC